MRTYIVSWDSASNVITNKTIIVRANSIAEAQNLFWQ